MMWLKSREKPTRKRGSSQLIFVGLLTAIPQGRLTASYVYVCSQDFEVFMQELEEDADLRSQMRLYKGKYCDCCQRALGFC